MAGVELKVGDNVIVKMGFLKGLKIRITEIDDGDVLDQPQVRAYDAVITEDHPTKPVYKIGTEVTFYGYELDKV